MRLSVRHRTRYAYDRPIAYAIQEVRLSPQPFDGQAVRRWQVRGESGRVLPTITDGFGNTVHMHSLLGDHDASEIVVEGEVATTDQSGVVRGVKETLPLVFYRRPTRFTEPDDALRGLAEARRAACAASPVEALHRLMGDVRDRIAFEVGQTVAATTAAEALAAGRGVCQDHAHVMIACGRHLGLPARYVSGYLWIGDDVVSEASHAWAEIWVEGLGWVGFDAANRVCPTEAYVRVASGLDYADAAPVRGVWRGAADEGLDVEVRVKRLA